MEKEYKKSIIDFPGNFYYGLVFLLVGLFILLYYLFTFNNYFIIFSTIILIIGFTGFGLSYLICSENAHKLFKIENNGPYTLLKIISYIIGISTIIIIVIYYFWSQAEEIRTLKEQGKYIEEIIRNKVK